MLYFCAIIFKIPMWVDNDGLGDLEGFLSPPSGLFPAPVPPVLESDVNGGGGGLRDPKTKALVQRRRSVIGRFRFLGRLAARCLMDGQVRNNRYQYSLAHTYPASLFHDSCS